MSSTPGDDLHWQMHGNPAKMPSLAEKNSWQ